jgi:hypothetical protein
MIVVSVIKTRRNNGRLAMDKLFLRTDGYDLVSAHEIPNNDLKCYAMYNRLDDVVIRINQYQERENLFAFDFITPAVQNINQKSLETAIQDIRMYNFASQNKKFYKIIERKV